MKKLAITLLLFLCATFSFAQKMTIKTCEIQYGDIINYNIEDIVMDGEPSPYVATFQVTSDYFFEVTKEGKHKYEYGSETKFAIKASEDFRITIKDENLNDYDVEYSYKNQTLTFIYSDGVNNLRLTRFTISNIKVK